MAQDTGYTVKDLAFWSGLILGTSCTHVTLSNLPAFHDVLGQLGVQDFARIIILVISLAVGSALGGAFLALFNRYQKSKKAAADGNPQEDYRKDYHEERDEHDPRR
jgi:hypothetical protein